MPNDKEFELDDLESFSFDELSLDDALDEAPPSADAATGEDPFGVWVKSAPEDVADEAPMAPQPPVIDDLPEEDFLSSEELAKLDDSFDFVTVSDEPLEGETPLEDEIAFLDTPEAVAAEKASPAQASFDEVSLDDFVSFDDVAIEEPSDAPSETFTGSEPSLGEDDAAEEFLDIDIDIDDDIGDEELEIIEGATPRAPEEAEEVSLDTFSAQDVDLSEFGDFEEVSPVAEGALAEAEDLPEVLDLPETREAPARAEVPSGFDLPDDLDVPSDLDLPADLDLAALDEPVLGEDLPLSDDGVFEETVLEDQGPVALDLEPDDQTDLDHILALEEDLTSGIRSSEAASPPPPPSDLAALILGKIEQELSSIKQEITELKKEVTHLRVAPTTSEVSASAVVPEPVVQEPLVAEEASKPHGFFDEEDDETIALTGDELDNILSTAEISEGEEMGESLDEDLLSLDEEGNLVDPQPVAEPVPSSDVLHVTDEEFLAGTALDLNEPEPLEDQALGDLGIPDSIELEEGLPLGLDESETEDLLASDDFHVEPLPEGLLEGPPEPLEIPFDDDIGLELEDTAPLAPDLDDEVAAPSDDFASIPEPDALAPPSGDQDGWSPAPLPSVDEGEEDLMSLEEEALPEFDAPPAVAAVGAPTSNLSPGLKDELKAVLQYMDKLLASLPDDKIQEFAESEHFEVYKRLFEELGLIE